MEIENRRIIDAIQGSPEWHQHRATSFNASEAAAMLGTSSYLTRTELLRQKTTGDVPDVDEATQRRFDDGHRFEAIARPWAEEIIGDTLYPVVLAADVDGLPLSVSMDGLTMADDVDFEHKSLNEKLAASLDASVIPDEYKPQMEQGLMISGATKCLFMASNGNRETMRYAWYESDPAVRAKVLAGWKQFHADLENYVYIEAKAEVVAGPVLNLPSVSVQVDGSIAIRDNIEVLEKALTDFVTNKLIRKPQTDQDFADLDAQIKTLKKAEEALVAAENHVISQVAAIDALKRTKDMLHKMARDNRLMAEKLLEAEKTRRRVEIQDGGKAKLAERIAALNARLGKPYMPAVPSDFVGVTKGMRSIINIQNAVDTELARATIAANEVADKIDLNLKTLREQANGYQFLFADAAQLVTKENDDLLNVIKARIAEHTEKEIRRIQAERERIRAEEERKANEKLEQDKIRIRQEEEARSRVTATTTIVEPIASPATGARYSVPTHDRAPAASPKTRPADAEIIEVLASHYRVHESTVIEWLCAIDLSGPQMAAAI